MIAGISLPTNEMPLALHSLTSPRSSGETDIPAALLAALAHPDDAEAARALDAETSCGPDVAQFAIMAARIYLRRHGESK